MDVKKAWSHLYAAYKIPSLDPKIQIGWMWKDEKVTQWKYWLPKESWMATSYQAKSILSEKLLQEAKTGIFIDKKP